MMEEGFDKRRKVGNQATRPAVVASTAPDLSKNRIGSESAIKRHVDPRQEVATAASTAKVAEQTKIGLFSKLRSAITAPMSVLKTGIVAMYGVLGTFEASLSLVTSLVSGMQPLVYGMILGNLLDSLKVADSESLLKSSVYFAIAKIVPSILEAIDKRTMTKANDAIDESAFENMRSALLSTTYEDLKAAGAALSISQVSQNLWRMQRLLMTTKTCFQVAGVLGLGIIAISAAPWPVIALALVGAIIPAVQSIHNAHRATEDEKKISEPRQKFWVLSWFLTNLMPAKDVRMLGVASPLAERREELRSEVVRPNILRAGIEIIYNLVASPISAACFVGTVYFLGSEYLKGLQLGLQNPSVTLGLAVLIITQAYPQFSTALSQSSKLLGDLTEAAPHIKNYCKIASIQSAFKQQPLKTAFSGAPAVGSEANLSPVLVDLMPKVPRIEFQKASYAFRDSQGRYGADVLQGVSFAIEPGETIALCGENGAGKSTLYEILVGLRQLREGSICLSGQPMTEIDQAKWATALGICFQDYYLFGSLTFRQILMLGARPVSNEYLEMVLEATGISKLLKATYFKDGKESPRFPFGLASIYGEEFNGGVELSGGERQRFAIARALLRRPAVLILDEFTSALDAEDAGKLYEFLYEREKKLGYKPTLIFSTHDYRRAEFADRVVMLSKEKHGISEQGTFDELRSKDGEFARKLQASIQVGPKRQNLQSN